MPLEILLHDFSELGVKVVDFIVTNLIVFEVGTDVFDDRSNRRRTQVYQNAFKDNQRGKSIIQINALQMTKQVPLLQITTR